MNNKPIYYVYMPNYIILSSIKNYSNFSRWLARRLYALLVMLIKISIALKKMFRKRPNSFCTNSITIMKGKYLFWIITLLELIIRPASTNILLLILFDKTWWIYTPLVGSRKEYRSFGYIRTVKWRIVIWGQIMLEKWAKMLSSNPMEKSSKITSSFLSVSNNNVKYAALWID